MKTLLVVLTLALAGLAIPSVAAQAAATVALPCSVSGGDTSCSVSAAGCDAWTRTYDVEDHPNVYHADCWGCGVTWGAGVRMDDRCYTPPPIAASSAAAAPCRTGLRQDTHCEAQVGGCEVQYDSWYMLDVVSRYQVQCGCVSYDNWDGGVRVDCIDPPPTPMAASAEFDPSPCTNGFAQTWCDATVGPCDVRVTPWTAWGDVYAWADCRGGSMTRCYAEVHTDGLTVERWCAF